MWHGNAKIRVIQPRFQALCKCIIFCFFIFGIFFGVKSPIFAQAGIQTDSIAVQAVVPLLDGFIQLLETHSEVRESNSILYPGEKTALSVSLVASGKEIFRHHRLRLELITANGAILKHWFSSTDDMGQATLLVWLDDINPGRYRFRVWDISYSERELLLNDQPSLSILEFPVADDTEVGTLKKQKMALTSQLIVYSNGGTLSNPMEITPSAQIDKYGGNLYFEMRSGP